MNDFTKDDLYILRRAVINLDKIDDRDSIDSHLYKKLQSMIDMHCDHENICVDEMDTSMTKEEKFWHPYSPPPRCDMCKADGAECYPPDNKHGYSGLCKDCFHIFYEENKELFK